jgi:hypothetical protein
MRRYIGGKMTPLNQRIDRENQALCRRQLNNGAVIAVIHDNARTAVLTTEILLDEIEFIHRKLANSG